MKTHALAAILVSVVSTNVLAEPDVCPPTFEQIDVDSDGVLSADETADVLDWDFSFFTFADSDKDGVLDRREFEELGVFCKTT